MGPEGTLGLGAIRFHAPAQATCSPSTQASNAGAVAFRRIDTVCAPGFVGRTDDATQPSGATFVRPSGSHLTHWRDLRAAFPFGVPQIIGGLHIEPRFRRSAECDTKPECKLCAHRSASVDHARAPREIRTAA